MSIIAVKVDTYNEVNISALAVEIIDAFRAANVPFARTIVEDARYIARATLAGIQHQGFEVVAGHGNDESLSLVRLVRFVLDASGTRIAASSEAERFYRARRAVETVLSALGCQDLHVAPRV